MVLDENLEEHQSQFILLRLRMCAPVYGNWFNGLRDI